MTTTVDFEETVHLWQRLDEVAHPLLVPLETKAQYEATLRFSEQLGSVVGENADSPLLPLLNLVVDRIVAYEDRHYPIPDTAPHEMLEFFMGQHGLKQKDLADIAPQSVVSELLSGKRKINARIAKALGERFKVSPVMFL